MSDHLIPGPEPAETDATPPTGADQVSENVAAILELTAAGVEVDGEVQVAESIWVVYGHTSYDGEIVVGEYNDAAAASEVLRAAPRHDRERPAP